tara:strand:+ start:10335 stop:11195 length:861 start_codon:yes stop_codon:yes gene_type:complete
VKKKEFDNPDFDYLWNLPHKDLPADRIDESWKRFRKVNLATAEKKRRSNYLRAGLVAAMLLVLCSTYYYTAIYNHTIKIDNYGITDKEIRLPDGSTVLLKNGGQISFKEHFESSRRVELEGSAFFNIVKDSSREFRVISGSTVTKVLGTKFLVWDNGDRDVEISLYTGRVLVSVENRAESWGLIPGESLSYRNGKTHIRKFNTGLTFDLGNTFMDLDNIELGELLGFLGKRFNYEFDGPPHILDTQVTLRINKGDTLPEILNLLSIINNMEYEINRESRTVVILRK